MLGANNGTLCLSINILSDQLVEETESFQVFVSSTDEAVDITNGTALIMIEDANIGKS